MSQTNWEDIQRQGYLEDQPKARAYEPLSTNEKEEADSLIRALKGRLLAAKEAEKEREGRQERIAGALLGAGISLIPSDDLDDSQFVVSRGVYEAARRLVE